MKLINIQTGQPIVEFRGDETVFFSKFLEHEMHLMGVPIPHGLRGSYHGCDTICLGDVDFQRAFKEVYYPRAMDATLFQWQDVQVGEGSQVKSKTE